MTTTYDFHSNLLLFLVHHSSTLVPRAAVTKPLPPVIFCQVRVSHIYVTESTPPVISYRLKSVISAVVAATLENYNK